MVDWGRRCLQIACGRRADKVFNKWPAALQRSAQLYWDLQDESQAGSEPRHELLDSSYLATGKVPCCSCRTLEESAAGADWCHPCISTGSWAPQTSILSDYIACLCVS